MVTISISIKPECRSSQTPREKRRAVSTAAHDLKAKRKLTKIPEKFEGKTAGEGVKIGETKADGNPFGIEIRLANNYRWRGRRKK